jgi:NAD(P)-dependent dehydrogenase (short-subunit alcohol dehydrogenase family)
MDIQSFRDWSHIDVHRSSEGLRRDLRDGNVSEASHEQRTEGRHRHRRVARHRRGSGEGLSGSQLPRGGDVPLDPAAAIRRSLAVAGDIGEPETADRVVAEALARFGRIDTLVNNAGIFMAKPFTAYTADDFAAKVSTNLAGFFHITQRAAAEMLKQRSGHIVSITTSLTDHALADVPSVLASLTKGGSTRPPSRWPSSSPTRACGSMRSRPA